MYLVTGGAGFIGSNLVAALCARGAEVMVVDRLRSGEKWRNLAHHPIAGILPPEEIEDFLAASPGVEAVIHMGAISDTTARDGDLVAAVNFTLPLWLWSWCAEHQAPFLYASSAATYGDGTRGFDARQRRDTLDHLTHELVRRWLRQLLLDAQREDVRRIEAEVDCSQIRKAPDDEARRDEHHDRQRHLGDEQTGSHAD